MLPPNFTHLTAAIYCRKSEENDERQVLSLSSQKEEAERLVKHFGIPNTINYEDSKSAKRSGLRPSFTMLMKDIQRGKIKVIICWKLDRLARNMDEGGKIIDLLQNNVLQAIITPSKIYLPDENAIAMGVEFAAANQYVRDLAQSVRRGHRKKAENGQPHGRAALGFLNDTTGLKGYKKWKVDRSRFSIVKKMFEMFLSGNYSGAQIHQWAIHEAKLTTPRHRKSGGRLVSKARVYEILSNPVYAGFFYLEGKQYELSKDLPRMISTVEHYRVKQRLNGKYSPKIQNHDVLYRGFIHSPTGQYIGADVKLQLRCDCGFKFSYVNKISCPKCKCNIADMHKPQYFTYVYYRNGAMAKRKESFRCVSEETVSKAFLSFVENSLVLEKELITWCLKYYTETEDERIAHQKIIDENKQKRLRELELQKVRYRDLLTSGSGLFTQEEYLSDIERINCEIAGIQVQAKKENWLDKASDMLNIGAEILKEFSGTNTERKRNILAKLGSNFIWDEKNLVIANQKPIQMLVDGLKDMRGKKEWLELNKNLLSKVQKSDFRLQYPALCSLLDNVRIYLMNDRQRN